MEEVDLKELDCTMDDYDKKLELKYQSSAVVRFDSKDQLVTFDKKDIYKFDSIDEYQVFKDNNKEKEYFGSVGDYKYDDNSLELSLTYSEHLPIVNYEEVYNYLKSKGFSCVEGIYHEE